MKFAGAGASKYEHLRAGCASEFRCKARRQNLELFQSVDRHEVIRPTSGGEAGCCACRSRGNIRRRADTDVGAHSIDHEVIGVRTLTVDAELSLVFAIGSREDNSGC